MASISKDGSLHQLLKQLVEQGKDAHTQNIQNKAYQETMLEKLSGLEDKIEYIEEKLANSSSDTSSLKTILTNASTPGSLDENDDNMVLTIKDFDNDLLKASLKWDSDRIKLFPLNEKIRLSLSYYL